MWLWNLQASSHPLCQLQPSSLARSTRSFSFLRILYSCISVIIYIFINVNICTESYFQTNTCLDLFLKSLLYNLLSLSLSIKTYKHQRTNITFLSYFFLSLICLSHLFCLFFPLSSLLKMLFFLLFPLSPFLIKLVLLWSFQLSFSRWNTFWFWRSQ